MSGFDVRLKELSEKSLPGGVAAAAVAAAMGAALVAKATRLTLLRQTVNPDNQIALQELLDLARGQQAALMQLADADERAYRALLEDQASTKELPAEGRAWYEVTEVPIQVAEGCHLLLGRLPSVLGLCWPAVKPDLEIGQGLLEAGRRAGLLAAAHNLRAREDGKPDALWARVDALKQEMGS